jgi:hypothetical protein
VITVRRWAKYSRLTLVEEASFRKRKIMMRAALIVLGLSSLAVMELETPARSKKPAPDSLEQTTVATEPSRDTAEPSRDTLTLADRFVFAPVQPQTTIQPVSFVEPIPPPEVKAIVPQEIRQEDSNSNQNRPGANNKKVVVKKPVAVKPKPEAKQANAKKNATTDHSKLTTTEKVKTTESKVKTTEIKACQPNAVDRLLKILNLPGACET